MTLRRYRSVADIPPPRPAESAMAGLAAACALSEASARWGHRTQGPRGIRRFRSVQAAHEHRLAWESGEDVGAGPAGSSRPGASHPGVVH